MASFQNKIIIVTGSSQGIGKFLALALAQRGAQIILNGRNPEKLEKVRAWMTPQVEKAPLAIPADVSNWEDCERLVQTTVAQFGRLDTLVCNAGINMVGPIAQSDPHSMRKVMDVNYLGNLFPVRAAVAEVTKTKGSILLVGSIAGFHGLPMTGIYSSSKMALTALAQSLQIELHDAGVHVGLAYVGMTEVEEGKTVMDTSGKAIKKPKFTIKPEPIDNAVRRMVRMLETRRKKQVFTTIGKINALMNRIAPGLVSRILVGNFRKMQKEQ